MPEDQAPSGRTRRDDPQPGEGSSGNGGAALRNNTTHTVIRNIQNVNFASQVPTSSHVETPLAAPIPEDNSGRRVRFKWSEAMNIHLCRTYLLLTKMETDSSPYGSRLHEEMLRRFPELNGKSIQNILDQRRQLFIKRRLTRHTMESIRREVAEELGMLVTTENRSGIYNEQEQQIPTVVILREGDQRIAYDSLQKYILLYQGMDPQKRPRIPKLRTNKNTKSIICNVNKALSETLKNCKDISYLHDHVYAAAVSVLELHQQKIYIANNNNSNVKRQPAWENRLQLKVEQTRKEIGALSQYTIHEQSSRRLGNRVQVILEKYKSASNQTTQQVLDYLKQKLQVYAHRLRRYREAYRRRQENNLFKNNQRAFYRKLQIQTPHPTAERTSPTEQDVHDFWSKIWGKSVTHNRSAGWIKEEKRKTDKIPYMPNQAITVEEFKQALAGSLNWKAAGPDKIQNFWYKKFTSTHISIVQFFNEALKNPEIMPRFLTQGDTYLLPKTSPAVADPSKYRPVTCLPTLYKIFTTLLANKIYTHINAHNLLATEQKGCRKGTQGCKDQLVIDQVIAEYARRNKRDLHTAFIDYQKAFDSVPHSWLIEVLELYKIDPQIINILKSLMQTWTTNIHINNKITDIAIHIRRGMFQGDALSALWFCIALNPLSTALNKTESGFSLEAATISHLAYMDDIKLLSNTQEGLKRLIRTTEHFSNDIRMNFGLDKCRTNHLKKGQWHHCENFTLLERSGGGTIRSMGKHEFYSYLGVAQSQGIDNKGMKENLQEKMLIRLKMIMKSQLSAANKVRATNTFVAPVITYSFGIIKWTGTELDALNRKIRTTYTKYRAHHPKACLERFHLPRNIGGRGVVDLRLQHKQQINQLREYFYRKSEDNNLYKIIVCNDKKYTPLSLNNKTLQVDSAYTETTLKNNWQGKELHGRHANILEQDHINKRASVAWLTAGNIFPETEGFLCAIQDQVMATRSYLKYIVKDPAINTTNCRMCGEGNETIEHIISSCKKLAAKEYTDRHNNVAKIIHDELCVRYGLVQQHQPYYRYHPESVLENETCKIYWDREILTDRAVQHNRPDICILNKVEQRVVFVEISVPSPVNIQKKHTEKIDKYVPLAQEVKELWRVKDVKIIPIILGATGEIPTQLLDNINTLGLPKNIYIAMQKAVILGTCGIVRKVLNKTP